MLKEKTLKEKIKQRLLRSKFTSFRIDRFYDLVPDFKEKLKIDRKKAIKIASTQVNRAFKELEKEHLAQRVGYGIYAKFEFAEKKEKNDI